jgi:hypothetical protein
MAEGSGIRNYQNAFTFLKKTVRRLKRRQHIVHHSPLSPPVDSLSNGVPLPHSVHNHTSQHKISISINKYLLKIYNHLPSRPRLTKTHAAVAVTFFILLNIFFIAWIRTNSYIDVSKAALYSSDGGKIRKQYDPDEKKFILMLSLSGEKPGEKKQSFIKKAYASENTVMKQNRWEDRKKTIKTSMYYSRDTEKIAQGVEVEIREHGDDTYELSVYRFGERVFKPGRYTMVVDIESGPNKREITQDFTWGVLALNIDKSVYAEDETAKLFFGVLNERGSTVCDALLRLKIQTSEGKQEELSTENGLIKQSGFCLGDNYTLEPDYFAEYQLGKQGTYVLTLTATTENGEYTITDSIEVKPEKDIPFLVERNGPTRINPTFEYQMQIQVTANQDFSGEITETMPYAFEVTGDGFTQDLRQDRLKLIWKEDLKKGETKTLTYTFDAPDISPEFYLLGPLQIQSVNHESGIMNQESEIENSNIETSLVFAEQRYWQIANDAAGDLILLWDGDTPPTGWTCISCTRGPGIL